MDDTAKVIEHHGTDDLTVKLEAALQRARPKDVCRRPNLREGRVAILQVVLDRP